MTDYRTDALGELRPSHKTADGYLYSDMRATRTGVYRYLQPDGSVRRELRHPDDVLDPVSMATLARLPVTLEHPVDEHGRRRYVTPDTVKVDSTGATGEEIVAEHAGGFVRCTAVIHRRDALDAVETGVRQVSAGYRCEFDATPGDWNGQKYDGRQKNIRYNHLALTAGGRLGADVALRADSLGGIQIPDEPETPKMPQVELDGVRYDAVDGLAQAVAKVKADLTTAQAANSAHTDKLAKLEGERDAAVGRADAAEKAPRGLTEDQLLARFNQRLALVSLASDFRVDGVDKLDDAALAKAVVLAANPKARTDASPAYYEAAVDYLQSARTDSAQHLDNLASPRRFDTNQPGVVNAQTKIDNAHAGYLERLSGAGKGA